MKHVNAECELKVSESKMFRITFSYDVRHYRIRNTVTYTGQQVLLEY